MNDKLTKCPACDGRGYFNCECWPGDCICGCGDETCEECGGEGIIDPSYDDFDPSPSPQPNVLGLEAIMDDVWNTAVEQAASIAKDCVHLTPEPDAAIRVMLNGRAKLHPASQAALSTTEGSTDAR